MTRIRLLVAIPGRGLPGDILVMPTDEEAAAWVGVGRAEFIARPRTDPPETATVQAPENTATRTRRPRGRP